MKRRVEPITGPIADLVHQVSQMLHSGDEDARLAAGRLVQKTLSPQRKALDSVTDANQSLYSFLQWLLDNDHYADAASLCWPKAVFNPRPRATQLVWDGLDGDSAIMLMGAASMSKTYGAGVYFFLDWLRDPFYTTVKVVGPSEDHLQDNLFSHLVDLHRSSAIPLPGEIGDLFIGLDRRQRRSSISGVVIPLGRGKKAGRLQGVKRFPRRNGPHKAFGPLSRLRVLMDEVENIQPGIWSDLDNLVANTEGTEGLKIAGAFNPSDPGGQCGQRCEPPGGWQTKDIEVDEHWKSKRGWSVVRLDALKSENVIEKRVIYPGLQTYEGVQKIIESTGGTSSPNYFTFVRAWFPPKGSSYSIIPPMVIDRIHASPIWHATPTKVGGGDISLQGGDSAFLAEGLLGDATGIIYPPSIRYPQGERIIFKDAAGRYQIRRFLWLAALHKLSPGDTYSMACQIRDLCVRLGIRGDNLCVDRTGNGAGVHDMLRNIWDPGVHGVGYSESATNMKVLVEDARLPEDECYRIVSEVWFAKKKLAEFDILKFNPEARSETLLDQMRGRMYRPDGKQYRVESKRDYMERGFRSPDEADAVTLMVHAARRLNGQPFTALAGRPEESGDADPDSPMEQWIDSTFSSDGD